MTLNLVPILDTMVTLIAFLLFTMSFLEIVTVESTFPTTSGKPLAEALKEKPLQLTVTLHSDKLEIWSPFNATIEQKIPNLAPGQPDLQTLHEKLVLIKQKFPNEKRVVLVPHAGATYDILIAMMDSIRIMTPTDRPLYAKNPQTGNDMLLRTLFPEIIFGNLLGDS